MPMSHVAKKYGVSINNLFRWKKTCERKKGNGRKIIDAKLEQRLIEWIKQEIELNGGRRLTKKYIQRRAK